LAIFGKFEHGATSSSDAGIRAYGEYVSSVQARLAPYEVQTTPSDLANKPGLEQPDATIEATLPDGRQVRVVVLLVDGVRSEGAAFDERYESLSTTADLIAYNGHSGLGANIRALANKGSWQAGQYVLVFMNGCDTYAYVDSALADAHIAVNPDDPEGTKYLDIITNAMPAPATFGPSNTMALTEALLEYETPSTYEMIFRRFNRSQVVLVSGEQDNVYYEGFEAGVTPAAWAGLSESGQVSAGQEVRLETPQLPAGDIRIQLSGTGDADLYVRVNEAPTTEVFDCRPYLVGSTEECTVTLEAPGSLHVLIRGYEALSDWTLAIH
jgi:hypothetical protein